MSKIDTQIKALQLKKKKIDYLTYVLDLIKNDTKCLDFKDVQQDVVSQIEPFILKLSESIENDTELAQISKSEIFSKEESDVLKLIASKALNKSVVPPQNPIPPNRQKPTPESQMSNSDKMNFALNNRHLGNKKVQVINEHNVTVLGTVVGLDAPFVVVKTDTGPTIEVPLEKVVLL